MPRPYMAMHICVIILHYVYQTRHPISAILITQEIFDTAFGLLFLLFWL